MTTQNGLTSATTISPNFVNIQLQHKLHDMNRASFTPAIDCKSHQMDGFGAAAAGVSQTVSGGRTD